MRTRRNQNRDCRIAPAKRGLLGAIFALLAGITFFGCGLPSKIPSARRATTDPMARSYVARYDKAGLSYGFSDEDSLSANQRWKFLVKCDSCAAGDFAGFYSARVVDTSSSQERILFTFWDADVGSGIRMGWRWSDDSRALRLKGETRGFAYRRPQGEPFAFDLLYLVEDDRMFRVTEDG